MYIVDIVAYGNRGDRHPWFSPRTSLEGRARLLSWPRYRNQGLVGEETRFAEVDNRPNGNSWISNILLPPSGTSF